LNCYHECGGPAPALASCPPLAAVSRRDPEAEAEAEPEPAKALVAATTTYQNCGVRGLKPCPTSYQCIDAPGDGCGTKCDIPGICIPFGDPTIFLSAGRMMPRQTETPTMIPPGKITNPPEVKRDADNYDTIPCGGFLGTPCPDGLHCIDDDRDDCDPKHGGADCPGVCVLKK
jgi:hypothetical protein